MADKSKPSDEELKRAMEEKVIKEKPIVKMSKIEPYRDEVEIKTRIVAYGEKEDKANNEMKNIAKDMFGF